MANNDNEKKSKKNKKAAVAVVGVLGAGAIVAGITAGLVEAAKVNSEAQKELFNSVAKYLNSHNEFTIQNVKSLLPSNAINPENVSNTEKDIAKTIADQIEKSGEVKNFNPNGIKVTIAGSNTENPNINNDGSIKITVSYNNKVIKNSKTKKPLVVTASGYNSYQNIANGINGKTITPNSSNNLTNLYPNEISKEFNNDKNSSVITSIKDAINNQLGQKLIDGKPNPNYVPGLVAGEQNPNSLQIESVTPNNAGSGQIKVTVSYNGITPLVVTINTNKPTSVIQAIYNLINSGVSINTLNNVSENNKNNIYISPSETAQNFLLQSNASDTLTKSIKNWIISKISQDDFPDFQANLLNVSLVSSGNNTTPSYVFSNKNGTVEFNVSYDNYNVQENTQKTNVVYDKNQTTYNAEVTGFLTSTEAQYSPQTNVALTGYSNQTPSYALTNSKNTLENDVTKALNNANKNSAYLSKLWNFNNATYAANNSNGDITITGVTYDNTPETITVSGFLPNSTIISTINNALSQTDNQYSLPSQYTKKLAKNASSSTLTNDVQTHVQQIVTGLITQNDWKGVSSSNVSVSQQKIGDGNITYSVSYDNSPCNPFVVTGFLTNKQNLIKELKAALASATISVNGDTAKLMPSLAISNGFTGVKNDDYYNNTVSNIEDAINNTSSIKTLLSSNQSSNRLIVTALNSADDTNGTLTATVSYDNVVIAQNKIISGFTKYETALSNLETALSNLTLPIKTTSSTTGLDIQNALTQLQTNNSSLQNEMNTRILNLLKYGTQTPTASQSNQTSDNTFYWSTANALAFYHPSTGQALTPMYANATILSSKNAIILPFTLTYDNQNPANFNVSLQDTNTATDAWKQIAKQLGAIIGNSLPITTKNTVNSAINNKKIINQVKDEIDSAIEQKLGTKTISALGNTFSASDVPGLKITYDQTKDGNIDVNISCHNQLLPNNPISITGFKDNNYVASELTLPNLITTTLSDTYVGDVLNNNTNTKSNWYQTILNEIITLLNKEKVTGFNSELVTLQIPSLGNTSNQTSTISNDLINGDITGVQVLYDNNPIKTISSSVNNYARLLTTSPSYDLTITGFSTIINQIESVLTNNNDSASTLNSSKIASDYVSNDLIKSINNELNSANIVGYVANKLTINTFKDINNTNGTINLTYKYDNQSITNSITINGYLTLAKLIINIQNTLNSLQNLPSSEIGSYYTSNIPTNLTLQKQITSIVNSAIEKMINSANNPSNNNLGFVLSYEWTKITNNGDEVNIPINVSLNLPNGTSSFTTPKNYTHSLTLTWSTKTNKDAFNTIVADLKKILTKINVANYNPPILTNTIFSNGFTASAISCIRSAIKNLIPNDSLSADGFTISNISNYISFSNPTNINLTAKGGSCISDLTLSYSGLKATVSPNKGTTISGFNTIQEITAKIQKALSDVSSLQIPSNTAASKIYPSNINTKNINNPANVANDTNVQSEIKNLINNINNISDIPGFNSSDVHVSFNNATPNNDDGSLQGVTVSYNSTVVSKSGGISVKGLLTKTAYNQQIAKNIGNTLTSTLNGNDVSINSSLLPSVALSKSNLANTIQLIKAQIISTIGTSVPGFEPSLLNINVSNSSNNKDFIGWNNTDGTINFTITYANNSVANPTGKTSYQASGFYTITDVENKVQKLLNSIVLPTTDQYVAQTIANNVNNQTGGLYENIQKIISQIQKLPNYNNSDNGFTLTLNTATVNKDIITLSFAFSVASSNATGAQNTTKTFDINIASYEKTSAVQQQIITEIKNALANIKDLTISSDKFTNQVSLSSNSTTYQKIQHALTTNSAWTSMKGYSSNNNGTITIDGYALTNINNDLTFSNADTTDLSSDWENGMMHINVALNLPNQTKSTPLTTTPIKVTQFNSFTIIANGIKTLIKNGITINSDNKVPAKDAISYYGESSLQQTITNVINGLTKTIPGISTGSVQISNLSSNTSNELTATISYVGTNPITKTSYEVPVATNVIINGFHSNDTYTTSTIQVLESLLVNIENDKISDSNSNNNVYGSILGISPINPTSSYNDMLGTSDSDYGIMQSIINAVNTYNNDNPNNKITFMPSLLTLNGFATSNNTNNTYGTNTKTPYVSLSMNYNGTSFNLKTTGWMSNETLSQKIDSILSNTNTLSSIINELTGTNSTTGFSNWTANEIMNIYLHQTNDINLNSLAQTDLNNALAQINTWNTTNKQTTTLFNLLFGSTISKIIFQNLINTSTTNNIANIYQLNLTGAFKMLKTDPSEILNNNGGFYISSVSVNNGNLVLSLGFKTNGLKTIKLSPITITGFNSSNNIASSLSNSSNISPITSNNTGTYTVKTDSSLNTLDVSQIMQNSNHKYTYANDIKNLIMQANQNKLKAINNFNLFIGNEFDLTNKTNTNTLTSLTSYEATSPIINFNNLSINSITIPSGVSSSTATSVQVNCSYAGNNFKILLTGINSNLSAIAKKINAASSSTKPITVSGFSQYLPFIAVGLSNNQFTTNVQTYLQNYFKNILGTNYVSSDLIINALSTSQINALTTKCINNNDLAQITLTGNYQGSPINITVNGFLSVNNLKTYIQDAYNAKTLTYQQLVSSYYLQSQYQSFLDGKTLSTLGFTTDKTSNPDNLKLLSEMINTYVEAYQINNLSNITIKKLLNENNINQISYNVSAVTNSTITLTPTFVYANTSSLSLNSYTITSWIDNTTISHLIAKDAKLDIDIQTGLTNNNTQNSSSNLATVLLATDPINQVNNKLANYTASQIYDNQTALLLPLETWLLSQINNQSITINNISITINQLLKNNNLSSLKFSNWSPATSNTTSQITSNLYFDDGTTQFNIANQNDIKNTPVNLKVYNFSTPEEQAKKIVNAIKQLTISTNSTNQYQFSSTFTNTQNLAKNKAWILEQINQINKQFTYLNGVNIYSSSNLTITLNSSSSNSIDQVPFSFTYKQDTYTTSSETNNVQNLFNVQKLINEITQWTLNNENGINVQDINSLNYMTLNNFENTITTDINGSAIISNSNNQSTYVNLANYLNQIAFNENNPIGKAIKQIMNTNNLAIGYLIAFDASSNQITLSPQFFADHQSIVDANAYATYSTWKNTSKYWVVNNWLTKQQQEKEIANSLTEALSNGINANTLNVYANTNANNVTFNEITNTTAVDNAFKSFLNNATLKNIQSQINNNFNSQILKDYPILKYINSNDLNLSNSSSIANNNTDATVYLTYANNLVNIKVYNFGSSNNAKTIISQITNNTNTLALDLQNKNLTLGTYASARNTLINNQLPTTMTSDPWWVGGNSNGTNYKGAIPTLLESYVASKQTSAVYQINPFWSLFKDASLLNPASTYTSNKIVVSNNNQWQLASDGTASIDYTYGYTDNATIHLAVSGFATYHYLAYLINQELQKTNNQINYQTYKTIPSLSNDVSKLNNMSNSFFVANDSYHAYLSNILNYVLTSNPTIQAILQTNKTSNNSNSSFNYIYSSSDSNVSVQLGLTTGTAYTGTWSNINFMVTGWSNSTSISTNIADTLNNKNVSVSQSDYQYDLASTFANTFNNTQTTSSVKSWIINTLLNSSYSNNETLSSFLKATYPSFSESNIHITSINTNNIIQNPSTLVINAYYGSDSTKNQFKINITNLIDVIAIVNAINNLSITSPISISSSQYSSFNFMTSSQFIEAINNKKDTNATTYINTYTNALKQLIITNSTSSSLKDILKANSNLMLSINTLNDNNKNEVINNFVINEMINNQEENLISANDHAISGGAKDFKTSGWATTSSQNKAIAKALSSLTISATELNIENTYFNVITASTAVDKYFAPYFNNDVYNYIVQNKNTLITPQLINKYPVLNYFNPKYLSNKNINSSVKSNTSTSTTMYYGTTSTGQSNFTVNTIGFSVANQNSIILTQVTKNNLFTLDLQNLTGNLSNNKYLLLNNSYWTTMCTDSYWIASTTGVISVLLQQYVTEQINNISSSGNPFWSLISGIIINQAAQSSINWQGSTYNKISTASITYPALFGTSSLSIKVSNFLTYTSLQQLISAQLANYGTLSNSIWTIPMNKFSSISGYQSIVNNKTSVSEILNSTSYKNILQDALNSMFTNNSEIQNIINKNGSSGLITYTYSANSANQSEITAKIMVSGQNQGPSWQLITLNLSGFASNTTIEQTIANAIANLQYKAAQYQYYIMARGQNINSTNNAGYNPQFNNFGIAPWIGTTKSSRIWNIITSQLTSQFTAEFPNFDSSLLNITGVKTSNINANTQTGSITFNISYGTATADATVNGFYTFQGLANAVWQAVNNNNKGAAGAGIMEVPNSLNFLQASQYNSNIKIPGQNNEAPLTVLNNTINSYLNENSIVKNILQDNPNIQVTGSYQVSGNNLVWTVGSNINFKTNNVYQSVYRTPAKITITNWVTSQSQNTAIANALSKLTLSASELNIWKTNFNAVSPSTAINQYFQKYLNNDVYDYIVQNKNTLITQALINQYPVLQFFNASNLHSTNMSSSVKPNTNTSTFTSMYYGVSSTGQNNVSITTNNFNSFNQNPIIWAQVTQNNVLSLDLQNLTGNLSNNKYLLLNNSGQYTMTTSSYWLASTTATNNGNNGNLGVIPTLLQQYVSEQIKQIPTNNNPFWSLITGLTNYNSGPSNILWPGSKGDTSNTADITYTANFGYASNVSIKVTNFLTYTYLKDLINKQLQSYGQLTGSIWNIAMSKFSSSQDYNKLINSSTSVSQILGNSNYTNVLSNILNTMFVKNQQIQNVITHNISGLITYNYFANPKNQSEITANIIVNGNHQGPAWQQITLNLTGFASTQQVDQNIANAIANLQYKAAQYQYYIMARGQNINSTNNAGYNPQFNNFGIAPWIGTTKSSRIWNIITSQLTSQFTAEFPNFDSSLLNITGVKTSNINANTQTGSITFNISYGTATADATVNGFYTFQGLANAVWQAVNNNNKGAAGAGIMEVPNSLNFLQASQYNSNIKIPGQNNEAPLTVLNNTINSYLNENSIVKNILQDNPNIQVTGSYQVSGNNLVWTVGSNINFKTNNVYQSVYRTPAKITITNWATNNSQKTLIASGITNAINNNSFALSQLDNGNYSTATTYAQFQNLPFYDKYQNQFTKYNSYVSNFNEMVANYVNATVSNTSFIESNPIFYLYKFIPSSNINTTYTTVRSSNNMTALVTLNTASNITNNPVSLNQNNTFNVTGLNSVATTNKNTYKSIQNSGTININMSYMSYAQLNNAIGYIFGKNNQNPSNQKNFNWITTAAVPSVNNISNIPTFDSSLLQITKLTTSLNDNYNVSTLTYNATYDGQPLTINLTNFQTFSSFESQLYSPIGMYMTLPNNTPLSNITYTQFLETLASANSSAATLTSHLSNTFTNWNNVSESQYPWAKQCYNDFSSYVFNNVLKNSDYSSFISQNPGLSLQFRFFDSTGFAGNVGITYLPFYKNNQNPPINWTNGSNWCAVTWPANAASTQNQQIGDALSSILKNQTVNISQLSNQSPNPFNNLQYNSTSELQNQFNSALIHWIGTKITKEDLLKNGLLNYWQSVVNNSSLSTPSFNSDGTQATVKLTIAKTQIKITVTGFENQQHKTAKLLNNAIIDIAKNNTYANNQYYIINQYAYNGNGINSAFNSYANNYWVGNGGVIPGLISWYATNTLKVPNYNPSLLTNITCQQQTTAQFSNGKWTTPTAGVIYKANYAGQPITITVNGFWTLQGYANEVTNLLGTNPYNPNAPTFNMNETINSSNIGWLTANQIHSNTSYQTLLTNNIINSLQQNSAIKQLMSLNSKFTLNPIYQFNNINGVPTLSFNNISINLNNSKNYTIPASNNISLTSSQTQSGYIQTILNNIFQNSKYNNVTINTLVNTYHLDSTYSTLLVGTVLKQENPNNPGTYYITDFTKRFISWIGSTVNTQTNTNTYPLLSVKGAFSSSNVSINNYSANSNNTKSSSSAIATINYNGGLVGQYGTGVKLNITGFYTINDVWNYIVQNVTGSSLTDTPADIKNLPDYNKNYIYQYLPYWAANQYETTIQTMISNSLWNKPNTPITNNGITNNYWSFPQVPSSSISNTQTTATGTFDVVYQNNDLPGIATTSPINIYVKGFKSQQALNGLIGNYIYQNKIQANVYGTPYQWYTPWYAFNGGKYNPNNPISGNSNITSNSQYNPAVNLQTLQGYIQSSLQVQLNEKYKQMTDPSTDSNSFIQFFQPSQLTINTTVNNQVAPPPIQYSWGLIGGWFDSISNSSLSYYTPQKGQLLVTMLLPGASMPGGTSQQTGISYLGIIVGGWMSAYAVAHAYQIGLNQSKLQITVPSSITAYSVYYSPQQFTTNYSWDSLLNHNTGWVGSYVWNVFDTILNQFATKVKPAYNAYDGKTWNQLVSNPGWTINNILSASAPSNNNIGPNTPYFFDYYGGNRAIEPQTLITTYGLSAKWWAVSSNQLGYQINLPFYLVTQNAEFPYSSNGEWSSVTFNVNWEK